MVKSNPAASAEPAEPRFQVDDRTCTLAELLSANVDDAAVSDWARVAAVGDRFPAFVECRRVS